MWFVFPEGTTEISVQQQTFSVEAKDEEGREYFRAPDHFAGLILDLPGFKSTSSPPKGAPADLPLADPLRDGAIGQLTSQVDALRLENENLRAGHTELRALCDDLKLKLHEAETELANLKSPEESGSSDFAPPKGKR